MALVLHLLMDFNITHINVWYDNISSKFNFQVVGLKVKVTLAIFRKNFVIALAPAFISGFYISSNSCWVL